MFVTTARMSRVQLRSTRAESLSEDVEAGAGAEAAGSFFGARGSGRNSLLRRGICGRVIHTFPEGPLLVDALG